MSDIKVLKVNAEGHYQEHDQAADSIKVSSLKTANHELTDAKLGALVASGDASAYHDHNSIYFGKVEFKDASAGAGDAGKPVKLDADGNIDASMINDADVSHDSTDGMAASTGHTAFPLLVGGRDFTAIQKYNSAKTFTDPLSLVSKDYIDAAVGGLASGTSWLDSIADAQVDSANVVSPVAGMRILINGTGLNDFASHDNAIATYSGVSWSFVEFAAISNGASVRKIGVDTFYLKNASSWSMHVMESTKVEANGPLFFSATYELDLALATSKGLKIIGAELAVEPSNIIDGTTLIDNADKIEINFSTTFNDAKALKAADLNASITPFSNGSFVATKVDTALVELYNKIEDGAFPVYVAATAIAKGDVLYISSNGSVSTFSSLTANDEVVGVALNAASISSPVKVAMLDFIVTGILSSAVAGSRYYWSGSALSTSMSVTSGENVWMIGTAKNATDLLLKVRHIRKNA